MMGNKGDQKMSDLDKRYEAIRAERDKLEPKRKELKERIEAIKAERIACAENGETEKYRSLSNELHQVEDDLFVTERRLAKLQAAPFSVEEILAAWSQYNERYADEIEAKMKQFAKVKADLLDAYIAMLDTQEKALSVRKHLFDYMGSEDQQKGINTMLPIKKSIPCRDTMNSGRIGLISMTGLRIGDPDFVYFASAHAIKHNIDCLQMYKDEALSRAVSIIELD